MAPVIHLVSEPPGNLGSLYRELFYIFMLAILPSQIYFGALFFAVCTGLFFSLQNMVVNEQY